MKKSSEGEGTELSSSVEEPSRQGRGTAQLEKEKGERTTRAGIGQKV